jgi:hypothetical protein
MIKYIIIFIFLISSVCYAQVILPTNINKCRKDFSTSLCTKQPDKYTCMKVLSKNKKKLYISWCEAFPDGEQRNNLIKINRRNTLIWKNHCIAFPNKEFTYENYSPLPLASEVKEKIVIADLKNLAWAVYENGKLIRWGAANGGMGRCRETGLFKCKTPIGNWKVIRKEGYVIKSKLYPIECNDKKICGHPMYWYVGFRPQGEGFHGDAHLPGINISHGCVRILKEDAKWLNKYFVEIGTKVIILPY